MPDQLDLRWLLLGFRLGQLTEIFAPFDYTRDEDDAAPVGQLLIKLKLAMRRCAPDALDRLSQIVSDMETTWDQRGELAMESGSDKPFELIHKALLQLAQLFREANTTQCWNWIEVGILLGQVTA